MNRLRLNVPLSRIFLRLAFQQKSTETKAAFSAFFEFYICCLVSSQTSGIFRNVGTMFAKQRALKKYCILQSPKVLHCHTSNIFKRKIGGLRNFVDGAKSAAIARRRGCSGGPENQRRRPENNQRNPRNPRKSKEN